MGSRVEKRLIVNADDFGFSEGVSAGIVRAHRAGIVTSTTITANMPAAPGAIEMLAEVPELGVGVHLNACQGPALSDGGRQRLADDDGLMDRKGPAVVRACFFSRATVDAIAEEFDAQIRWVLDHGITPTHLDSHRHVHGWPGVFKRVAGLARTYNIRFVRRVREHLPPGQWPTAPPDQRKARMLLNALEPARRRAGKGLIATTGTWGIAHTGLIDADWLVLAVSRLPGGVTEIMTHPGDAGDLATGQSRLLQSRQMELDAVCDSRVRDALQQHNIRLTHYGRL